MNKVNLFLALTASALILTIAPCPLIFLSSSSNTDEDGLDANLRKTYLDKRATPFGG